MSLVCTRCGGTGFLNAHQLPQEIDIDNIPAVLSWIDSHPDYDVAVCDCCGNGEDWYGVPGEHYNSEDPPGPEGPYAYNGGLCECN